MDISKTLIGKSDQLDNVDLMSGPRDFTITGVSPGPSEEQPLNVALAEFHRPWRPNLTMRRLLAAIWGADASAYVGRRIRLYRDATVLFGKTAPGGTRLSHASHLDKAITVTLPSSKGKFAAHTVMPLPDAPDAPTEPSADQVAASTDQKQLREWWKVSSPERKAQIEARGAELSGGAA